MAIEEKIILELLHFFTLWLIKTSEIATGKFEWLGR